MFSSYETATVLAAMAYVVSSTMSIHFLRRKVSDKSPLVLILCFNNGFRILVSIPSRIQNIMNYDFEDVIPTSDYNFSS